MPKYDYKCSACGHEQEHEQRITEDAWVICPKCRKRTYSRQIKSAPAALFKGPGFYHNDRFNP